MKNKQKPNRKSFFRFIKSIVKIFKRKPHFKYLGEKPQGACIYISNHSAASGPVAYELYLPTNMRMWGTHEMCGGFKERWAYLNYVYFKQKKKLSKFISFILATFLTPFLAMFYKGMRIIPTYSDFRFANSIKTSIDELENGTSILIFPENSSDGYHEIIKEFYGGFYALAKLYNKRTGKDIDIVNMYFDRKSNTVIVGTPKSYCSFAQQFKEQDDAVAFFLHDMNNMYSEHILPVRNFKHA